MLVAAFSSDVAPGAPGGPREGTKKGTAESRGNAWTTPGWLGRGHPPRPLPCCCDLR